MAWVLLQQHLLLVLLLLVLLAAPGWRVMSCCMLALRPSLTAC